MLFEILCIVGGILGGVAIAWAIENILPKVVEYLKRKSRERAIMDKGTKINEWMKNIKDPEILAELDAIRKANAALLAPLNHQGKICYDEVVVIRTENATGEDRMSDRVQINADGTYNENVRGVYVH